MSTRLSDLCRMLQDLRGTAAHPDEADRLIHRVGLKSVNRLLYLLFVCKDVLLLLLGSWWLSWISGSERTKGDLLDVCGCLE